MSEMIKLTVAQALNAFYATYDGAQNYYRKSIYTGNLDNALSFQRIANNMAATARLLGMETNQSSLYWESLDASAEQCSDHISELSIHL